MVADQYHEHARPQMRPFVPVTARTLLDVGCGAGAFAAALAAEREAAGQSLEIWGIELDPAAAATAAARLTRVLPGKVEDVLAQLPEAYFDCVVCNDILEHLAWPQDVLRNLRRVMRPGAVLVASIPNVRFFFNAWDLVVRGDWSYTDEGIRDRTHLRFYTRRSMRDLFRDAGYSLIRQQGINPTRSWRFRLANLLALGTLADMQYLQFACVAAPALEPDR